jgi:hypothetical protein
MLFMMRQRESEYPLPQGTTLGPEIRSPLELEIETPRSQTRRWEVSGFVGITLSTILSSAVCDVSVLGVTITIAKVEPQPCQRFKRMRITKAFLKHLPKYSKCQMLIARLKRESEIHIWTHKHRN